MSDANLVGSLRGWSSAVIDQAHAKVGFDAADRIERLEAQLAKARELLQEIELSFHGALYAPNGTTQWIERCDELLEVIEGQGGER